ncbi:squalene--hopene cyclase [Synechococcus sp. PCC 7336]|uniref:squalene--hopene cyclase n=1 Tax=Synechococcus sp. PCC 7336 TaxID=195250 RepID=UPI0003473761|nr:squalene--hopene cyclase [Synechococcus sp. PCC 7336]
MQTQDRPIAAKSLAETIAASQNYLLSQQYSEGYWWAELQSNVTITAEVLLLHKIWGTDGDRPVEKIESYLRQQQRGHGGWELYCGDGGELSVSVEGYMALRLCGVPAEDPALLKAKDFIVARGGISKTRIFTKFHLALIGCYDWRGLPSIPPWIMLLPNWGPFTIYDMSSWARESTVPLAIVFDRKPVYTVEPKFRLDELYAEGIDNVRYELPKNNDWSDAFVHLDTAFKWGENLGFVPCRAEGLRAAEQWVLERMDAAGDWGDIIPAMLNSMLALKSLDYGISDPIVERGFRGLDNFAIEHENDYHIQPCISPIWDTAWVVRAMAESGCDRDRPELVRATQWLMDKQILGYGDWRVKNPKAMPGGWAFEFENRFYPDLDDSAVVVMAINQIQMPNEALKRGCMERAVGWMQTMQCKPGGWGAFDIDNDADWLNSLPYGDLKAMIDPNTADVTARVLEMLGECGLEMESGRVERAIAYLKQEQEPDGCWFGRWGVNYIYGTSGALSALALLNPESHRSELLRGAEWLASYQNQDGGWGETCESYRDPSQRGRGDSTASQTAWSLIGLIAVGNAIGQWYPEAMGRGVDYLMATQRADGTWDEDGFTGTGFPNQFYLKYHYYQQYFPLLALGRYQAACEGNPELVGRSDGH